MPLSNQSGLADAAHLLSDQMTEQLEAVAARVAPRAKDLDQRFRKKLKTAKFDDRQMDALSSLTLGSVSQLLHGGGSLDQFFRQAQDAGRVLAKTNVEPPRIVDALNSYIHLAATALKGNNGEGSSALWIAEQLHFCVILTLNNAYYDVRESETDAFQKLVHLEVSASDEAAIFSKFLEVMSGIFQASGATLARFNNGDAGEMFVHPPDSEPSLTRDIAPADVKRLGKPLLLTKRSKSGTLITSDWRNRFESIWSIPIQSTKSGFLVVQFGFASEREWLPRELQMLNSAAERWLEAVDRARLMRDLSDREQQLKELAEHMLHVEEMERRRISRELHDEAGQSLVCIRLQLELLEMDLKTEDEATIEKLRDVREMTERTILDIRRLISDLSPAVLEQLGLGAAVRQLCNRFKQAYPCRMKVQVGKLGDIPQRVQIVTYRLLQECCNNIAKHSAATNVNISVNMADGVLRLDVQDNGVGFVVDEALTGFKSFGLSGMRERVALLGGQIEVKSGTTGKRNKGKGTGISIEIPVPNSEKGL